MAEFKIGVLADSFRLGIRDNIRKAKEAGASGIQIYATQGELAPENLTAEKRKELRSMVAESGLVISALCGDLGGGFAKPEENAWKIEKSKRIMDLAKDLGVGVITTHIGVVPQSEDHPRWKILQEACEQLGEYGDGVGAVFAIETGPETSATLGRFLDSLHSKGVRVNLDPANLVMVTGDDPVQAVYRLKDYIVHTHAKDGVMLRKGDPEVIYGMPGAAVSDDEAFREVPLGEGSVDFSAYLRALDSIGYHGFLTIEREVGENPEQDIRAAVAFLNRTVRDLNRA